MPPVATNIDGALERWLERLEMRHLESLTFQEVRKGLQAVSRLYVQKRERLEAGAVFAGAGKRAAFALFYGPLHFVTIRSILTNIGAPTPRDITDLGCGTGVGGAAWATSSVESRCSIVGVDLNRWAVQEANHTYRDLGLKGRAKPGDLLRVGLGGQDTGIIAAYTVNELSEAARSKLLPRLLDASRRGATLLIVEPIARTPLPWWDSWARPIKERGGREDEWDLPWAPPSVVERLDKAAGLSHRSLKARTLFLAP